MPDDHYSCKHCGQFHCVCPQQPSAPRRVLPGETSSTIGRHKPTGSAELPKQFSPASFMMDFRENTVTWEFDTAEEAQRFAEVVNKLIGTSYD